MTKTTWRCLLLGLAGTLGACADEINPRPPASELKEGLTLIDATDPTWGTVAAFKKDGRVIYMETRVGAEKPAGYRQAWPDDPENEMDIRFVDQNGITFYAVRGGDNFVDPTWGEDLAIGFATLVDPLKRDLDFRLAREASAEFAAVAPTAFAAHSFHLAKLAAKPVPHDDPMMAEIIREQITPKDGVAYAVASGAVTDLFSAGTGCFAWICWAKHSATRTWGYAGNVVLESCNHGRCSWEMGWDCQSYGPGGDINGETLHNSVAVTGACQTPYNWSSGGWDHLCNDDSSYELWQTHNGAAGDGYSFTYDDPWSSKATSNYACVCSWNNGCDNDWGRPSCPAPCANYNCYWYYLGGGQYTYGCDYSHCG